MISKIALSKAVGGGYDAFWNSKKRYRVLKGGKASKKSATTALNLIYRLLKYKESNILVVRAVMNTHRDSTFAQLKWAQEKLGVAHLFKNTVSPMEMTYLPTNQKILFRGFDDVLKLAGATVEKGYLNFVWVEEAFEIDSLEDFEKLDLSVPRGALPKGLFKQTTITFNPWSEKHWLKSRFFDKTDPDTDTFSTNYLINEFLDDTDKAVFERLKSRHPRRYRVAGLGEWGIAEGLIYENWETGIKETNSDDWEAFFGLDYGYTSDPTAFIAFKVNRKLKEIYIFDEIYQKRMLNCDIARAIAQKGYAKERIRADSAEPKSNDDLRRLGIRRIMPSVKGRDSVINGIMNISEYSITVNPKCKNCIAELSSYCWRKGEENVPEDKNNHLLDALRYAFYDVKRGSREEITEYSSQMKGGWDI
ncbi:MAG: PBSX family phage terminase large subunit [Clostridia bacterium]|nr:PBSX family phage terminase large subunit [Clostridia bacterium]